MSWSLHDMEVVPVSNSSAVQLPLQTRNVQEWSRLDRLTGMLEHARVETDQWATNTVNNKRKYSKVVDSRARNLVDGSVQQRQRKQLEVFQAQVPGASFQVIRTQSVTSTSNSSTSSRWQGTNAQAQNFDNLQLSVHPLDLGLQKNKVNIGRCGSIRTRRPPSRPKSITSKRDSSILEEKLSEELNHKNTQNIDSRLSQVSRICRQIHETAKQGAYRESSSPFGLSETTFDDDLEIKVTPSRIQHFDNSSIDEDGNGVHIEVLNENHPTLPQHNTSSKRIPAVNGDIHKCVSRRKSSSTEDLKNLSLDEEEKNEWSVQGSGLKRTSQIRRSLQLPLKANQEDVNAPLARTEIVKSLRELEDTTVWDVSALKGCEALERVFWQGANIAESVNKSLLSNKDDCKKSSTESLVNHLRNETMNRKLLNNLEVEGLCRISGNVPSSSNKRHSFVTVESLKEVRGRLRHLGSHPVNDISAKINLKGISCSTDELDDGIVTEELGNPALSNESVETTAPTTHVRSYVFGMESQSNDSSLNGRRPIIGTGSLESRTSSKSNGSGNSRSEEWYSRRKSYGFEPVHSHNADEHSNSIKLEDRNKVESSTDSGICRSSETVAVPIRTRLSSNKGEENDFVQSQATNNYVHTNENVSKISHNIHIKEKKNDDSDLAQKLSNTPDKRADDSSLQKGRKTVVTLGKKFRTQNLEFNDEYSIVVQNSVLRNDLLISSNLRGEKCDESRLAQFIHSPTKSRLKEPRSLSEPLTVTIPVVPDDKGDGSTVKSKRLFFRQLSEGTSLSIESSQKKGMLVNSSAHKENSSCVSHLGRNSHANFKERTWNSRDNMSGSIRTSGNEMKRHSIAVDESKYVREGLNSFMPSHENSRYHFEKEFANVSTSELVKRFAAMDSLKQSTRENNSKSGISVSFIQNSDALLNNDENSDELQQNGKKQKKVEFCKTEVHFAAESGRFNIVETDEKPPPSNMFRRRRRSTSSNVPSSPTLDPNKYNLPELRFGDSPYEKILLGGDESSDHEKTVQLESMIQNTSAKQDMTCSMILALPKFQTDAEKEDQIYTQANSTIIVEDQQDSTNLKTEENVGTALMQNDPVPRSILKNNKKPRPFLLGEGTDLNTDQRGRHGEEEEEKWGIRLRPVQNRTDTSTSPMWRSTVTLQNTVFDSSKTKQPTVKEDRQLFHSSSDESELQKLFKSLQPPPQRNSINGASISETYKSPMQVKISTSSPKSHQNSPWSVADRIKQVEDFKKSMTEIKGYSTRINFGSGETTVVESRSLDEPQEPSHKLSKPSSSPLSSSIHQSNQSKPIWLHREERKRDSVILPGHPRLEANTEEPQQRSVVTTLLPSYDQNRLRTVETLISIRNGQPKITSISLQYEEDQDMDPLKQQDSLGLKEDDDNKGERRLQSNQTDGSNITASFSYASETSLSDRSRCSLKDKTSSELYLKNDISQDSIKSETILPQSSVSSIHRRRQHLSSSKEKRLNKDEFIPIEEHSASRKNNLYDTDKNNSNSIKERLYIKDTFLSSTRNGKNGFKDSQSKSENDNSFTSSERQKINFSPSKNSMTAANHSHQSEKERAMSAVNSHQNPKSANNECLSDGLHSLNSLSPTFNRGSSSIIESRKKISASNLSKICCEVRTKFFNQNTDNSMESDSENILVRNAQKTKPNANAPRSTSRGRSASPTKSATSPSSSKPENGTHSKIPTDSCDMHVYENRIMESKNSESKLVRQFKRDGTETDSTILEELTKAADQILQAVTGYTDEESAKASSDDDENGRRGKSRLSIKMKRSSASLGTISELPVNKHKDISQKTKATNNVQKPTNNVRRTQRLSKSQLSQNSSTSSIESCTREVRKCSASLNKKEQSSSTEDREKHKATNLSSNPPLKPGNRTARFLQRASSRELLLKTHESSSEDIMSGTEDESSRKPRAPRRNRINTTNTSKTASSVSATTGTKNPSSTPQPAQNKSSSASARLRKKDANEISSGRERHPLSAMKQTRSADDQARTHSIRLRETRQTTQDGDSHRKHSRREAIERIRYSEREGKEKTTGNDFTPVTSRRHKSELGALEQRSIGTCNRSAVVKASTSHIVKKKPSSSRSEGGLQTKSSKCHS